jgi:ssDNA thymidine ADP-ribosyltransferase, DarT
VRAGGARGITAVLNDTERKALLNAEKARIFRIVHRDNIRWILQNGVHCSNSQTKDAAYVTIGNTDIISMRTTRQVPVQPGGTLSDYVPFYFTPYSPMAYNIKTGFNGIRKRDNAEIVILVTSLPRLMEHQVPFVYADRHAYMNAARFSSNAGNADRTRVGDLTRIDWTILQAKDFQRDNDDPGKMERYQAEALVHKQMPISSLAGIACYNDATVTTITNLGKALNVQIKVLPKPAWYFT